MNEEHGISPDDELEFWESLDLDIPDQKVEMTCKGYPFSTPKMEHFDSDKYVEVDVTHQWWMEVDMERIFSINGHFYLGRIISVDPGKKVATIHMYPFIGDADES